LTVYHVRFQGEVLAFCQPKEFADDGGTTRSERPVGVRRTDPWTPPDDLDAETTLGGDVGRSVGNRLLAGLDLPQRERTQAQVDVCLRIHAPPR